ncbi:LppM family (lipo)protein [Sanguibacter suaedae]|uniref:LppM domain-containing protein n=1 Tax=Sanguibacter suaedae TaxID=2795737 RepID=A0A934IA20_9MICO|nr:hypothetical protein [Sanguibacter suaedae]MBI9115847.1 hypothetical protein [Sanguibacter suaedae]
MRTRRFALVAGTALLAGAIAGCGKVTADTTVHDDASYDITLLMVGEITAVEDAGNDVDAFADQAVESFELQPGMDDYEVVPYTDDEYVGAEITGTSIPGDDLALFATGLFETDEESETVVFDFQYPLPQNLELIGVPDDGEFDIMMTVTFPGEVIEHNGTAVDAFTVEWTSSRDEEIDYTATSYTSESTPAETAEEAADEESEGINWLLWISIAVAVLALVGLVLWFTLSRRGPKNGGAPQAAWPTQQPGVPGQTPLQPGQAPQQQWAQPQQQPGQAPFQTGPAPHPGQQQWGQPQQPGTPPQQPGEPGQAPQPPQHPQG